jgi:hypothetical protein
MNDDTKGFYKMFLLEEESGTALMETYQTVFPTRGDIVLYGGPPCEVIKVQWNYNYPLLVRQNP